jgi:hypothetical protein
LGGGSRQDKKMVDKKEREKRWERVGWVPAVAVLYREHILHIG